MGGWFNKKIISPSDFKGLKFRMPGLGGEVLKSFGTNVVLLPGPDVVRQSHQVQLMVLSGLAQI